MLLIDFNETVARTNVQASEDQDAQRPIHILLVEDDEDLRATVTEYLTANGFLVHGAGNAKDMGVALDRSPIELIILDIMLPGEDGLSICRRLSRSGAPPIIVVSAMGEHVDRVVGLELGADDYLPKPCLPRELLARMRAVLRRYREPRGNDPLTRNILRFENFALDLVLRHLRAPDGERIFLTNGEFALLSAFLAHPGHVLSREELVAHAYGDGVHVVERVIDVQISRLRRKLPSPVGDRMIRTHRGIGYCFDARVTSS